MYKKPAAILNNKILQTASCILVCSIFVIGCEKNNSAADQTAYVQGIKLWQENRSKQIGRDDGWLSLAGLFWLKEGKNSIGTDPSNTIVLPKGSTPPKAGTIILKNGDLSITSKNKTNFHYKDSLITRMELTSDESGKADPTILSAGSVSFYTIKRGDRYGIRIRDKKNPALRDYKGLDFYAPDPAWRIEAVYKPHPEPKLIEIASIIGSVETDTCPGMIILKIDGRACSLDVTSNPKTKELYLMFTDETTGKETYGNGRQLSTTAPDQNGNIIIDFNKAANWPCAYTPYGTCPIPPKQNHIPARIEAGEKKYPGAGSKTPIN